MSRASRTFHRARRLALSGLAVVASAAAPGSAPARAQAEAADPGRHARVSAWLAEVADCEVADVVPEDWVPAGVRSEPEAALALADFLASAPDLDLNTTERVLLLLAETRHPRTAELLLAACERAEELVDRALTGRMHEAALAAPVEVPVEIDYETRAALPSADGGLSLSDPQQEREDLERFRLAQVASFRRLCVRSVAGQSGAAAVEFLERALADPDPRARLAAARGLARQPGFPGRSALAALAAREKEPFKALLEELLYR